jgi:hypothetical protein
MAYFLGTALDPNLESDGPSELAIRVAIVKRLASRCVPMPDVGRGGHEGRLGRHRARHVS